VLRLGTCFAVRAARDKRAAFAALAPPDTPLAVTAYRPDMSGYASVILVAASLLAGAAHSAEGTAMRHKPSRDAQLLFVDGPAAAEEAALRDWLRTHTGVARQLRLPVRLATADSGQRESKVGSIAIGVGDAALGISLADRVRAACGDAADCLLWLEGYWSGTQFDVRKVGPLVVEPLPRVGVQADQRSGKAVNAKVGAALQPDTGEVIYLDGLAAWPAGIAGQRVNLSGILVTRKLVPDAAVGTGGAISAGASGPQTVMESPRWSIVE